MSLKNRPESRAYYFIIIVLLFLCACKKDGRLQTTRQIVAEWTGKEIKFPDNVPCYVFAKDTLLELCDDCFHKEYKILLYVDSTGCSNCRLKLFDWKQLIEEAEGLFPDKVGFLLFFQPKNLNEIDYLFVRDLFYYPVFMDTNDEINRLNHFPQAEQYQCFLLNSDNKVLAIGNPVLNLKIWELYKSQITGGKQVETGMMTSAMIDKVEHDYGTIRKGSMNPATFTITNAGDSPLVITRISTSCGCTKVTWDKQPIGPRQTTTIHVEMTPNETGSLRKTIVIYSNTNESPMRLTLIGTIIE